MAHFEIKNLTFSYPQAQKSALCGINLSVNRGEYITLCGKSGCGKTTLLRHLKSVLAPHGRRSGDILFEGTPLSEVSLRDQSSKIGYVMQNPDNQIVTDKVWHELAFGLESLGLDQRVMRLRVAEMASYFGIQTWFHKNVNELSGGQKQLLNLASIMAMHPSALILDEPTSQLDPIAASDFLNTVRKINLELGTTVILSEHRLEEVLPAADRVVVMEDGSILADGSPQSIGGILKEKNSDMFGALPSPVQIFYGMYGSSDCPLTVREGRNRLTEIFSEKPPETDSIEETRTFEEPEKPALELQDVWFRYEKDLPDVLKGVCFKAPAGGLFAVVGGNGTGKSTMLKCLCGILRPYRGKVIIKGKKADKYNPEELYDGCIAMLPQDPQSLFVKKTVEEELSEMLAGKKYSEREREDLINGVIEDCDIRAFLASHPYDLSGGEQQRAALAKVLLCRPEILLLDEPTKGMDSFFKAKFAKIIKRLTDRGTAVIMASHDLEFCAKYADSVSMFFDGGIITSNTPVRFFSENSFYTTAANRISRHIFKNAITNEDVIKLCQLNKK